MVEIPSNWTSDEIKAFETLAAGEQYDALEADERQLEWPQFAPTRFRRITLSGEFIATVIRKFIDQLPTGLQIRGVYICGEVAIENVRVDRMVVLEKCHFDKPILARNSRFISLSLDGSVCREHIDLRNSVIEGSLFIRAGFHSLTTILLRDVAVRGVIDCSQSLFAYDLFQVLPPSFQQNVDGECFSLARSSASALFWRDMLGPPEGYVNLRNCKLGSFRDDLDKPGNLERNWPAKGKLRMSGLRFDERTSTAPSALIAWIGLQDRKENPFGSYQSSIKTLLESGNELSADRLILEKQRFLARREPSVINRFFRYCYIFLSHAGLNTARILRFTAGFFVLSYLLVLWEAKHDGFMPKSYDVVKDACYNANIHCSNQDWQVAGSHRIPKYYPNFSALGYTIEMFIPFVNYGTGADWRPSNERTANISVAIRTVGTICWALLLVCLSGLSRYSR